MSGDLPNMRCEMATNDFVNDLKSLSSTQTDYSYSTTIERLLVQLNKFVPNSFTENMPLAMALVDNLYRIIPVFESKLSENAESTRLTNLFLETIINKFDGFCLFDLFLTIKESSCLEFLFRKYSPLLKQSYFTNDTKYDKLINCLLPIFGCSSILIHVNEDNFPPNLLSILLQFVQDNWLCKSRETVIHNILSLIKILSKSPITVPMVIRSEWPNACIQCLSAPGPRPSYKIDFYMSLILQKIARHPSGIETLNKLNCIKLLAQSKEQMKKDHSEEEFATINFIQYLTYTLLVEADELKRNSISADKLVCDVLGEVGSCILNAANSSSFFYKGCHVSEFLCVLSKLFVNDDLLSACLKKNTQLFDCLSELLIKFTTINTETTRVEKLFNDEASLSITNLLWSISFHESYHDKFKSNAKLMEILSNLATSSSLYTNKNIKLIPADVAPLKKSAESILWNLKSTHLILPKEKSSQQRPMVMISYSHNDSKFCHDLVDDLSQHVPVWVDYKQAQHSLVHSDDVWEEIAGAMESASVIVLIVSKDYYDSKSCRQELSYASDTLRKRVVPVYAPNQQYKANGWLGIRIAGQKYIHFGKRSFHDALDELLSALAVGENSAIKPEYSHQPFSVEPTKVTNPLNSWTTKEIRKWFEDNHIHEDLIKIYADDFHTGTSLLVYAHHLKQFYRNEYLQILANFQKEFPGKRLQTVDYITFVDAFWRLRQQYDPQSKLEDAMEKYGGNQLPSVMKILSEGLTWL